MLTYMHVDKLHVCMSDIPSLNWIANKGVLAIRCILSLVDMNINTKLSNCRNVFKISVVQQ